jgi:hypothetical protein
VERRIIESILVDLSLLGVFVKEKGSGDEGLGVHIC